MTHTSLCILKTRKVYINVTGVTLKIINYEAVLNWKKVEINEEENKSWHINKIKIWLFGKNQQIDKSEQNKDKGKIP